MVQRDTADGEILGLAGHAISVRRLGNHGGPTYPSFYCPLPTWILRRSLGQWTCWVTLLCWSGRCALQRLGQSAATAVRARKRQYQLRTQLTELKQAELALRKQNERQQLLWEAASVLLTTEEPDAMMQALFAKLAPHLDLDTYFSFRSTTAAMACGWDRALASAAKMPKSIDSSSIRLFAALWR